MRIKYISLFAHSDSGLEYTSYIDDALVDWDPEFSAVTVRNEMRDWRNREESKTSGNKTEQVGSIRNAETGLGRETWRYDA